MWWRQRRRRRRHWRELERQYTRQRLALVRQRRELVRRRMELVRRRKELERRHQDERGAELAASSARAREFHLILMGLVLSGAHDESLRAVGLLQELRARRRRHRSVVLRSAIVAACASPAQKILTEGNSDAYLLTMGVNKRLFDELMQRFLPVWCATPLTLGAATPSQAHVRTSACVVASFQFLVHARAGCSQISRRKLSPELTLSLVLNWLHSRMTELRLGLYHGLTQSASSRYLTAAKHMLWTVLQGMPEASVCWPSQSTCDQYRDMISRKYEILDGVVMMVDGLMLPMEEPVRRGGNWLSETCATILTCMCGHCSMTWTSMKPTTARGSKTFASAICSASARMVALPLLL